LVVAFGALEECGRLDRHPARGDAAEERTGDDHRGDRHQDPEPERQPEVRVDGGDGDQRARVRRHQPVHDRQSGQSRYPDPHQGQPGSTRDEEDHRDEEDQSDLEEHREADEGPHRCHRPGQRAVARPADDGVDDLVRPARVDQEPPDDRTERDQHADGGDGGPDPGGERRHRGVEVLPRDRPDHQGAQRQAEQGVQLQQRHQEHEHGDSGERRDDQPDVVAGAAAGRQHDGRRHLHGRSPYSADPAVRLDTCARKSATICSGGWETAS
jgi:hypothetical protein